MNQLSDYDGTFPAVFYFYDIEDEKLKKMGVPETVWNDTLKTFEGNNNIKPNVIFKYMSKHDNVETEEV